MTGVLRCDVENGRVTLPKKRMERKDEDSFLKGKRRLWFHACVDACVFVLYIFLRSCVKSTRLYTRGVLPERHSNALFDHPLLCTAVGARVKLLRL